MRKRAGGEADSHPKYQKVRMGFLSHLVGPDAARVKARERRGGKGEDRFECDPRNVM